ncbi:hypothetical protein D3C80_1327710 [compost metagenome]
MCCHHIEETNHQHKQRVAADASVKNAHQRGNLHHQQGSETQGVGSQFPQQRQAEGLGFQQGLTARHHVNHAGHHKQLQHMNGGGKLLIIDIAAAGIEQAAVVEGDIRQRWQRLAHGPGNDRAVIGVGLGHQATEILGGIQPCTIKQRVVIQHHARLIARQRVRLKIGRDRQQSVVLRTTQTAQRLIKTAVIGLHMGMRTGIQLADQVFR